MSWRSKSYEVLPALSVRRGDLRRYLRIATISWLYGSAWTVLVSGVQLKSFARMLGFDDFQLGLLAAAPPISTFGMIVAAEIIERSGLRKYQFLYCGIVHRLLWVAIAAIPLIFVHLPSNGAVWAMLLIYTFSWLMNSFANPAWTTWMGDLVPRRIRGRFFAARFGFGRIAQVILVVAIGILLDATTVTGAPETAAAQPMLLKVICAIFALAAVIGATEIWMYRKVREIAHEPPQAEVKVVIFRPGTWTIVCFLAAASLAGGISTIFSLPVSLGIIGKIVFAASGVAAVAVLLAGIKDGLLKRYVGYSLTISFAGGVTGFFFWVYTTETLGFSKLATQVLFMAIGPILGMIGLKVWGMLLDRWGRRPVLILATCMTVFSVTPYFFTTPGTPCPHFVTWVVNGIAGWVGSLRGNPNSVWITPDMPVGAYLIVSVSVIVGGIGWTGVNMGQNNFMLGFADSPGRSRYFAASSALVCLGPVIGGPLGGYIVYLIKDSWHLPPLEIGPFVWTAYHATFAVSAVGRVAALLWLIGMPDPGAGKVSDLIRHVGAMAYGNVSTLVLYPFRIFTRGR